MVTNVIFLKHFDFILIVLNQLKNNNYLLYINLLKLKYL